MSFLTRQYPFSSCKIFVNILFFSSASPASLWPYLMTVTTTGIITQHMCGLIYFNLFICFKSSLRAFPCLHLTVLKGCVIQHSQNRGKSIAFSVAQNQPAPPTTSVDDIWYFTSSGISLIWLLSPPPTLFWYFPQRGKKKKKSTPR